MAQAMVAQAISLYDAKGGKAAFKRFNKKPAPEFKHLDLYIFVMNANNGKLVAHAQAPSIVGIDARGFIDPDGINIGQVLMDAANPVGAWVDYQSRYLGSDEIVLKSTWAVLHDGYIFGCGIHPR